MYNSFCGVLFIPRTMLLLVLEARGNNGVGRKENVSPFFQVGHCIVFRYRETVLF